jgi:hypothetical protein
LRCVIQLPPSAEALRRELSPSPPGGSIPLGFYGDLVYRNVAGGNIASWIITKGRVSVWSVDTLRVLGVTPLVVPVSNVNDESKQCASYSIRRGLTKPLRARIECSAGVPPGVG